MFSKRGKRNRRHDPRRGRRRREYFLDAPVERYRRRTKRAARKVLPPSRSGVVGETTLAGTGAHARHRGERERGKVAIRRRVKTRSPRSSVFTINNSKRFRPYRFVVDRTTRRSIRITCRRDDWPPDDGIRLLFHNERETYGLSCVSFYTSSNKMQSIFARAIHVSSNLWFLVALRLSISPSNYDPIEAFLFLNVSRAQEGCHAVTCGASYVFCFFIH